jgi:hypothetical protein
MTAPRLILAGRQGAISKYETGIPRELEKTAGSNRHSWFFQNALHNTLQIPTAHLDIVPWQTDEDRTWSRERLQAVSAHFIKAFFDWHLTDDNSRARYCDLPIVDSKNGTWV